MGGYRFTDRTRKVLQMARQEALRLHHEFVGTEHILLGLIREGDGVAVAALTQQRVDVQELQRAIEQRIEEGSEPAPAGPDLPYTVRAKTVLEFAMTEARELNHPYIGTEHLLLGLLREEEGIAAQVLRASGVGLASTRNETLRLLASAKFGEPRKSVRAELDQAFTTAIALIELHRLRFGSYPASLEELQFLGSRDPAALANVKYERLREGYALDVYSKPGPGATLSYPGPFWHGLGIRRTNVGRPSEK
jgi:ATP-dependent Clp protease ATP-binding subunit ClpA